MNQVNSELWPEFMFHDAVSDEHWNNLYDVFPDFQFGLMENRTGRLVATANSIPLAWHGTTPVTARGRMELGYRTRVRRPRAGRLSAHAVCAVYLHYPDFQGKALSL
jgi:hypothetical protein